MIMELYRSDPVTFLACSILVSFCAVFSLFAVGSIIHNRKKYYQDYIQKRDKK